VLQIQDTFLFETRFFNLFDIYVKFSVIQIKLLVM